MKLTAPRSEEQAAQNFFPLDHDSKATKEITLEPPKKSEILPLQLRTPFGVCFLHLPHLFSS